MPLIIGAIVYVISCRVIVLFFLAPLSCIRAVRERFELRELAWGARHYNRAIIYGQYVQVLLFFFLTLMSSPGHGEGLAALGAAHAAAGQWPELILASDLMYAPTLLRDRSHCR